MQVCPCGRQGAKGRPLAFTHCCQPWLGGGIAPDAECLMRSRYSAYVLGDVAYLLSSWHPSTRPAEIELGPDTRWLGLQVRLHRQLDASHAEVEFVARLRVGGRGAHRLHEISSFVRENERWFYVDGVSLGG